MKNKIKLYAFIVLEMGIIVLCALLATYLRFEFNIPRNHYEMLSIFIPIAIASTAVSSIFVGNYNNILSYFGFTELLGQILVSAFTTTVILACKVFVFPQISGSITVIYGVLFFLLSTALRGIPRVQKWLAIVVNAKYGRTKRIMIVGAGDTGVMLAKQIMGSDNYDMYPVVFVDDNDDKQGKKVANIPVKGKIEDAPKIAKLLAIDEIIIAIPSASKKEMLYLLDKTADAGIPTRVFRHAIDAEKFMSGETTQIKEVSIEDLLFREPIVVENPLNRQLIEGKVVLVTGGVGSIGSELCRQVLENGCEKLIIFDIHENGLFEINEELKHKFEGKYITCLASVRDVNRIDYLFSLHKPSIVFHAAAHKHVPMMEINPFEAIKNNVIGTQNIIEAAIRHKSDKLILISTDKAVHPTNIMGATKRVCELMVKAYCGRGTEMVAVRFGNVLESNGSVIPLFKKQIAKGGPVTVTHRDMVRYFMTIKEAVSLVLSAGAFAKNSELFVLDMGEPVKIYELANSLIKLSGKTPDVDIKIEISGLRPGEKLFEEIVLDSETVDNTSHKKIFILKGDKLAKTDFIERVAELKKLADANSDEAKMRELLFDLIVE